MPAPNLNQCFAILPKARLAAELVKQTLPVEPDGQRFVT
jgi:hypothetical protein